MMDTSRSLSHPSTEKEAHPMTNDDAGGRAGVQASGGEEKTPFLSASWLYLWRLQDFGPCGRGHLFS